MKYSHKKTDKNKTKIEMKISPVNDIIARKLSLQSNIIYNQLSSKVTGQFLFRSWA